MNNPVVIMDNEVMVGVYEWNSCFILSKNNTKLISEFQYL